MIRVPSGVKVWLATGHTDMRKGFAGLSLMVQETLKRDPMSGHLVVFRGRSGGLIKVIWHDGQGACLFTKKLERGRFIWHRRPTGRWLSRQRSSDICSKASTGECHKKPGVRRRRDEQNRWHGGATMIPFRHDQCGRSASRRTLPARMR
ncbi:IS66 family insertion sequence element accessory protein TnpB [Phyllobacterium salinisoli]|uniref:IS66 family insertion sequence element accessory protein TnpB n=1 Tax=Phyllobacterium salinisoli TaxID=1899321 RepID=UPI0026803979